MEYIPENLYRYNRKYVKARTLIPMIYVKVRVCFDFFHF